MAITKKATAAHCILIERKREKLQSAVEKQTNTENGTKKSCRSARRCCFFRHDASDSSPTNVITTTNERGPKKPSTLLCITTKVLGKQILSGALHSHVVTVFQTMHFLKGQKNTATLGQLHPSRKGRTLRWSKKTHQFC